VNNHNSRVLKQTLATIPLHYKQEIQEAWLKTGLQQVLHWQLMGNDGILLGNDQRYLLRLFSIEFPSLHLMKSDFE
jgi:hypothetical protein